MNWIALFPLLLVAVSALPQAVERHQGVIPRSTTIVEAVVVTNFVTKTIVQPPLTLTTLPALSTTTSLIQQVTVTEFVTAPTSTVFHTLQPQTQTIFREHQPTQHLSFLFEDEQPQSVKTQIIVEPSAIVVPTILHTPTILRPFPRPSAVFQPHLTVIKSLPEHVVLSQPKPVQVFGDDHVRTTHGFSSDRDAVIIDEERIEPTAEGFSGFRYQTSNGIQMQEQIQQDKDGFNIITGSYSYTSPEGIPIAMSYIADRDGFRYVSDSLPVGPEEPPHATEQRLRGEELHRLKKLRLAQEALDA